MGDLIDFQVHWNSDPVERDRLLQAIKTSDEWLRFAVGIASGPESVTAPSQAGAAPAAPQPSHPLDAGPDIVKRRAIVRQNPGLKVAGLCSLFDDAKIPVPTGWISQSWSQTCKNPKYRQRIQVIVSKDRRKGS